MYEIMRGVDKCNRRRQIQRLFFAAFCWGGFFLFIKIFYSRVRQTAPSKLYEKSSLSHPNHRQSCLENQFFFYFVVFDYESQSIYTFEFFTFRLCLILTAINKKIVSGDDVYRKLSHKQINAV